MRYPRSSGSGSMDTHQYSIRGFAQNAVGSVVQVSASARHGFSKTPRDRLSLISDRGVEGDAHFGITVKHLFSRRHNPKQQNLRQVHLLEVELLEKLASQGVAVGPGELGENILTRGIRLTEFSWRTRLQIGSTAEIEITGLRSPCLKIDRFQSGLRRAVSETRGRGNFVSGAVMAVVVKSGVVGAGDQVLSRLPGHPSLELPIL